MPGVGTVVGGLVTQGYIVENMQLAVGPFEVKEEFRINFPPFFNIKHVGFT